MMKILKAYTNPIGMEFVLIPAGKFLMGSKYSAEEVAKKFECEAQLYEREHPQHNVTISQPFYLQSTAVTQGQWGKVVLDNPSTFNDSGDDCPVETVSWDDVQDFIKKLNEIDSSDDKYRLPTEAEWEYACRAGTTTEFSFGEDASGLDVYGWYSDNSELKTHPVGQKKPNGWGLYDMHGNVWEWVEDDCHSDYEGAPEDGRAWIDKPRGADRVMRGGGWGSIAPVCRSAYRRYYSPGARRLARLGFRLARSVALDS